MKKILSVLTASIMAVGLLGTVPAVNASSEAVKDYNSGSRH